MPSPVSYFDFHEGSGSIAASSVGGFTLTAATPATAWSGTQAAGQFTGAVGPPVRTAWTAAFDVNILSLTGTGGIALLHVVRGDGDTSNLYCEYISPTGHLAIYDDWTSQVIGSGSSPVLTVGAPHKAAYVADAAKIDMYLDGVLVGTATDTHLTVNLGQTFTIGDDTPGSHFKLDGVRFWNVALTPTEVAALSAPPPAQGIASGSYSWAATAVGTKTPKGSVSSGYAWAGTATGKRQPKGVGAGSYGWAASATGAHPTGTVTVTPPSGVTVTPSGGGYDSDGNPIGGGAPVDLARWLLEVAPGNTTQAFVTGGEIEAADYTVYLELGAPIGDDDVITVRGKACRARVKEWRSRRTGRGGLEVLCKSSTGITGG